VQAPLPDLAADIKAGAIRQAHIEDDQMGMLVAGIADPFAAVVLPGYPVAISFQTILETVGHGRVIFDEQD
jgi:hypothetical protein